jgi:hypothetical protein
MSIKTRNTVWIIGGWAIASIVAWQLVFGF